jgi:hypothetical protein
VLLLGGGVHLVASLAGASLDILVDMQVVEILFPIPEIGKGLRFGFHGDLVVVALEAHGEFFFRIGSVKFIRKVLVQESGIFTSMGVVTGTAIALIYRTVQVGLDLHVFHQLGVTGETQFLRRCRGQFRVLRGMGIMARLTIPVGHRIVLIAA